MNFEEFKITCLAIVESTPAYAGWRMSFSETDYQREWRVSAEAGGLGVNYVVFSASAGAASPRDAMAGLARLMREMQSEARNLGV